MSTSTYPHEVNYAKWCPHCKYYEDSDTSSPCNECLALPYNYDSRKPQRYSGNTDWLSDSDDW